MDSEKKLQFSNKIPMEFTTHMKNKKGKDILVYLNWEFKQEAETKPSQILFKIRTNRFLEIEDGIWERVIDFKDKLSTEFYICIDYPENGDTFFKEKGQSLSLDDLKDQFGINLYNIWQRFIDKPCSWETESPSSVPPGEMPPDYLD